MRVQARERTGALLETAGPIAVCRKRRLHEDGRRRLGVGDEETDSPAGMDEGRQDEQVLQDRLRDLDFGNDVGWRRRWWLRCQHAACTIGYLVREIVPVLGRAQQLQEKEDGGKPDHQPGHRAEASGRVDGAGRHTVVMPYCSAGRCP